MDEIQSGGQVVRFDRLRTIAAYATVSRGDTERCGCLYRRNFAAQRSSVYPEVFSSLLNELGIDPKKEGEVYELFSEFEVSTYGGWFYFAREVAAPSERIVIPLTEFEFWFSGAEQLPKPVADLGDKVAAVNFVTKIAWALADQPAPPQ